MNVDFDLVKKYNVPGPRYTSYPTALQFRADIPADELLRVMREDVAAGGNAVSVYVHIPFCRALCWYCGCTNVPATGPEAADRYLDALEKEIALRRKALGENLLLRQLHFGGGTPSALTPAQIDRLAAMLREAFSFAEDAEISVEIDPRTASPDIVDAFRRLGCSRASFGVQDLDEKVQLAIRRVQPEKTVRDAVALLRERGFRSVNFDLIYGLPHQTAESCSRTIDAVLALSPDRLSVFSYAHVPWIKPQQKLLEKTGAFPSPDEKLGLFKLFTERLTRAGYVCIGMDHFAKITDELAIAQQQGKLQRNFQGYSTRPDCDMVALGVSAISNVNHCYACNPRELSAYYEAIRAGHLATNRGYKLSLEDQLRHAVIMTIMCQFRVVKAEIEARFGIHFDETFAYELRKLQNYQKVGFVELTPDEIVVSPKGKIFVRAVAMQFDRYLRESDRAGGYSKIA